MSEFDSSTPPPKKKTKKTPTPEKTTNKGNCQQHLTKGQSF